MNNKKSIITQGRYAAPTCESVSIIVDGVLLTSRETYNEQGLINLSGDKVNDQSKVWGN